MRTLLVSGLRSHARRFVASGLAVILGVAFVAATLVLSATLHGSISAGVAGDLGSKALVVTSGDRTISARTVARIVAVPGAGEVRAVRSGVVHLAGSGSSFIIATVPPSDTSAASVAAGRLPRAPGEMAISTRVAARTQLAVGDRTRVERTGGGAHGVTVVGVVDTAADPRYGATPLVFGSAGDLRRWTGVTSYDEVQVSGASGTSVTRLESAVQRVAPGTTVRTGPEQADLVIRQVTGGTDLLTQALLVFAAVALFVALLVIGNTFTILVAQRTRELALVRCVGAGRGQVFRSVLLEAVSLGLCASGVGVGVGVGLAALLSELAGDSVAMPLDVLTIPVRAVVVPVVIGTLMTVAAAVVPAVRATSVAPLAALRPDAVPSVGNRLGRARLVVGGVALVTGALLLLLGARAGAAVVGIAGGMVSFLGVLALGSLLVPALARVVGAVPARLGGVPGRLALLNAVRNPRRAAATCSALLVGVTLITMMAVGASTAQVSVDRRIASEYALDADVVATRGALAPATVRAVSTTDGVVASTSLDGRRVTLAGGPARGRHATALAVRPGQVGSVLRSSALAQQLRPGVAVVGEEQALELGLDDGERQRLRVGERSLDVRVVVADAPAGILLTPSDLAALAPGATTTAVWLRFADDASPTTMMDRLETATAATDAEVGGAAPQRAEIAQVVDVTLLVVTGLLAVAVLIALVGIANTLSLSVLERTRESALLRSLGLTRTQLRSMVAVEALVLSGVGVLLGTVLGVGYGWAGSAALLGRAAQVDLTIPWPRVVLAVVVAVLAGLLAAVWPARRAARVAPASALAVE